MERLPATNACTFAFVQSTSIVPFLVPLVGALATFLFNRGSRLRRARTAALEDLQLHERALVLFGAEDPVIDQVRAHARESLRAYNTRRAADAKRPVAWLTAGTMTCASLVLSTASVALGADNAWVLLALGALVGVLGIGAEAGFQKAQVRLALKRIPTGARDASGEME